MLDQFHILSSKDNSRIFYASDSGTWQTWTKPRKCSYVLIMCLGAGAGGLGGGAGGAGVAPGGGTGGICKVLYPAYCVPDLLYVQPGVGTTGGAGATGGSNSLSGTAGRSFVSITPSSATTQNLVCVSGTTGATNNAGETAITTTNAPLLTLGTFQAVAGLAAFGSGLNVTPFVNGVASMVCPGANGSALYSAPNAFPGYDISSTTIGSITTPTISGGAVGASGKNGMWTWGPFMYGLGGSGGGGVTSGTAPNGGDAIGYGCGGGGGGNAPAGGTGGNGGRGGDGLIIISAI